MLYLKQKKTKVKHYLVVLLGVLGASKGFSGYCYIPSHSFLLDDEHGQVDRHFCSVTGYVQDKTSMDCIVKLHSTIVVFKIALFGTKMGYFSDSFFHNRICILLLCNAILFIHSYLVRFRVIFDR